ncbi:MAG: hypothetical protein PHF23_04630 [Smithellaceae bacterium]|nr:hypothetical protein [Smithellaceae bacterium]
MKVKIAALAAIALVLLPSYADAENIVKAGSDILVEEGQTVDNVAVIGGQITVNGLVENNVLAIAGSVVLTNKAVVRGKVIVLGGVMVRGSGSTVFGDVTEVNASTMSEAFQSAMRGELEGWSLILNVVSICFFAIILMIALIMTLLVPRHLTLVTDAIAANRLRAFFLGILATLMIAPLFMLLAISIIGIFLIPLAFTALLLAVIIGFIASGAILGHWIISRIFRGHRKSLVKETLVGLSLLWLLGWIPLYIGMTIKVFAITIGLGGVLLSFSRKTVRPIENRAPSD